ncbi:hypothetical protein [Brevundimonas sp.]|nr:hypothetical protein [Brevundimonas sp.]
MRGENQVRRTTIALLMTGGQVSDDIGAAALLARLPLLQWLLDDRGRV